MPSTGPASFTDLLELHPMPELAEALKSRIIAIMARWEASVRRLAPVTDPLTFTQLRDDSLNILRQLADALACSDPAAVAALVESSHGHASIRFEERYDLRELIIEYRLLRRIIIEEVEPALPPAEGTPQQSRNLTVAEQVALNMGIDAMLQRAVLAFVDHQEERLVAIAQRAATAAEHARIAVAIATEQTRAAVAVATEHAKVAATAMFEHARDAAWATAEQATAAAWATAEQATAAALAIAEQAKDAAVIATEQARTAVAVATEHARDAATATSDEAREVAWAASEEAKAAAANRSQRATAVASAISFQAAADAAAASQSKDHFLAVLSHELRNPLMPVLATASLLQLDERFDEETRGHLEVIRRNAELEAMLIDDLLDVTRISSGKMELDRRPVELGTILRHAVEVCQPDIEARGLHFELVIKDAPHIVHADAGRLQQVFWNLIKNAVKFTPRDGCVGVRAYRHDGLVGVEVNDSGVGMGAEAMTRIFNAFEQSEISVTRRFGGLGLGLAISKALVELHGGTITAASPGKDQGATFTVSLPLVASPAPSSIAPEPETAPGEPTIPHPRRLLRVLLVEDHGDTARILTLILRTAGHSVVTTTDVASALALASDAVAEGAAFDLLLSDVGLPDGSGVDLMKELRRRGNALPGIALSGYGQEEDVRQTLEAGYSHHLLKPVTAQRLLALVGS